MAELEMLPAWAGRMAEPTHPPQPPTPPSHYANDTPVSANGHAGAVLVGQPPLPSGEHRLEPDTWAPPADDDRDGGVDDDEPRGPSSAMTTSELPVVSIPFDDETTPAPEQSGPDDGPLIDTVETPVDALIEEAGLDDLVVDAELVDDVAEADDPDEIELLEDTDPIGSSPDDNSPVVAPVAPPDAEPDRPQGRQDQEAEHERPALRVFSLLALALVVVAAGVAAGYLFVALTGG